jgi:hypothetical protein
MTPTELAERVFESGDDHLRKLTLPSVLEMCEAVVATRPDKSPDAMGMEAWRAESIEYYQHSGREVIPGKDVGQQRFLARRAIECWDFSEFFNERTV